MSMKLKITITTAALLAAFAAPALASSHDHHGVKVRAIVYLHQTSARASVDRVFDADARGPYNSPAAFAGYSTEYLMNRFGDRQLQGR